VSSRRLLGSLLLSLLAIGCSRKPPGPAERGRATFVRICSGCHGMDGRGAQTIAFNAPTPPRNLTDPSFQAQRTDEQLLFALQNGKGNMPPFGALLEEAQLRDLVTYVRTLRAVP
jgi:mono/diheme cytochrome c family protein